MISPDLRNVTGTFEVQWYDTTQSRFVPATPVTGGGRHVLTTPFPGPAAVHLKRTGD